MAFRFRISTTWLLAAFALLAGVMAFWSAQRFLDQNATGVRRQWERRYALRPVLVAARDLTAGQVLRLEDIARREMPAGFLPSGTFTDTDTARAVGRRLTAGLRAGDPVGETVIEALVPALAYRLPEGSRAVTVPVDEVSSQAGLVRPGDRVDLMLAEERIEGAERCIVVRSLLESVHVLATGKATRDVAAAATRGTGTIALDESYSTITLDVTPEQAQQLAVGLRMGELIPMLRGAGDDAPTGLAALGDGRLACRGVAREAAASPAGAPRRLAIDVLVGGRQPADFSRLWVPDRDF